MDINVTYIDGKWITDPNPAIVTVGTRIRWVFRSVRLSVDTLAWRVRFGEYAPFGDRVRELQAKSVHLRVRTRDNRRLIETLFQVIGLNTEFLSDHITATEEFTAEQPGEYKYDLEVSDAESEEILGDEDPYLYVLDNYIDDGAIKAFRR